MRQRIVDEAASWVGTPYHSHARLKGIGVDCAMLVAEVFEACGVIPHVDPGYYSPEWHLHRTEEKLLGWLARLGVELPADHVARPGDIAAFRTGRAFGHTAIVTSWPNGIHACREDGGVYEADLTQGWLAGRDLKFFTFPC